MPESKDENPCKSCGVCCSHFRISFYQGELDSNGGYVPNDKVIQITPFLVAMNGTEQGGRCNSLQGKIGEDISCAIYSKRPSCCREFPVWLDDGTINPKCNELRIKHKLPLLKNKFDL